MASTVIPRTNATPLIADLLDTGCARIDPLRLGLDVAPDCTITDRNGRPDPRIREQASTLARELLEHAVASA